MKQLIIGIDGGTKDIFERMPMPFLHSLIADYAGPELEIDLLSRGWAEQLTGKCADTNKGFYVFPKLDGTREFLFKYSLQEMLDHPDVSPIWDIPLAQGARVGVMNIPTTFPAPKVDGFFVSGAGGGLNKVDGVPEAMCSPAAISTELEELNYVVDIRLGTAGISKIEDIFDKLEDMAERRVDAYIAMCQKYQPEFGFLAFRHLSVIEYLGMSEIMAILGEDDRPASAVWDQRLKPFFAHFDSLLKRLFDALAPARFLFTSDHGVGPTREYCNPNAFLQEKGYQPKKLKLKQSIHRTLHTRTPSFIRKIDWEQTKAFSDWYSSCIYIHDTKRFGGPIAEAEIDAVVDAICHDFNNHPDVVNREIRAEPYRRQRKGCRYYDQLADIRLVHKPSLFVASTKGPFFSPNPNYKLVPDMTGVSGGMHSGNKTAYPFFAADPETAKLIREDDPKDLTLVYKLTERIFAESKSI